MATLRFEDLDRLPERLDRLGPQDVDVWSVEFDASAETLAALTDLLSPTDLDRAARLRIERQRNRWIAAQGVLRKLLALYTGFDPAELEFRRGPLGKPSLETGEVHFNLSHTGDHALLAVARAGPVGIDVERPRRLDSADALMERYFSAAELDAYRRVPAANRDRAFFNCWTRKEAVVKALGEGMFRSLRRFDVSLTPDEPARVLAFDGDREAAKRWHLLELEPAVGLIAALALDWPPRSVKPRRVSSRVIATG